MSGLPKPYWEEPGITIFNSDCRNILPLLEPRSVDLVLTDPPYNCGKVYGSHDDSMGPGEYQEWLSGILGACAELSRNVVYFPGTRNLLDCHRVLGPAGLIPIHVLGWHKKEFAGDKWNSGPAQCWEPIIWASREEGRLFNTIFGTAGRDFLVVNSTHGHGIEHPCPKPPEVLRWLVGLFATGTGPVLDPFAGSGTTALACKALGIPCTLIEIEEKYCRIAVERLRQAVLPLEPEPKPEQLTLETPHG